MLGLKKEKKKNLCWVKATVPAGALVQLVDDYDCAHIVSHQK